MRDWGIFLLNIPYQHTFQNALMYLHIKILFLKLGLGQKCKVEITVHIN